MNRKQCLEETIKCICADREGQYGSPENNFSLISELWSAYKGENFTIEDVVMMLVLLKVARIKMSKNKCNICIDSIDKICKFPTEKELINIYGVCKKTNEPMKCSDINDCGKCLFIKNKNGCRNSMCEWINDNFLNLENKIDNKDIECVDKKNKFKLEDYDENYVMHCDSFEQFKIFCDYCKIKYDKKKFRKEFWNFNGYKGCAHCIVLDDNRVLEIISDMNAKYYRKFNIVKFNDFDWSDYEEGNK